MSAVCFIIEQVHSDFRTDCKQYCALWVEFVPLPCIQYCACEDIYFVISYETNEVYVDLCETSKGDLIVMNYTASHLATGSSELKSKLTADLYGHLNLTLMLAVAS